MTSAPFLPEPQRRLFYGIWTIVALGIAIWAVPSPDRWTRDRIGAPKVVLAPELQSMFAAGRVIEHPAESYLLELDVVPAYAQTVPEHGRDFSLGYQYRKAGSVLRHGLLPLRISKDLRVRFRLPNPERSHPTDVLLSLLP